MLELNILKRGKKTKSYKSQVNWIKNKNEKVSVL